MVIEVVSFKIRQDIAEEDFLNAASAANTALSGCAGFIRRRLAKADADEWMDFVEWQSMADALAAAMRFGDSPDTKPFNEAIESGSTALRHLTVRLAAN